MHAAALLLEALQRGVHRIGAAEHVADDVGTMQPRQHVLAVADAAVDERHVLHLVERRHVGVAVSVPISLSTGNSPTRSTSFSRA